MVVKAELENLGISYSRVDLGEVVLRHELSEDQRIQLKFALWKSGLELMDDKKALMTEKIKKVIVEMVHYDDEMPKVKASIYISKRLKRNYTYLSNIFSEVTGSNIGQYIITQKIERVKELLKYEDLNLSQISFDMNYSSVAHLSNQFKKLTGYTPTFFKHLYVKRPMETQSV